MTANTNVCHRFAEHLMPQFYTDFETRAPLNCETTYQDGTLGFFHPHFKTSPCVVHAVIKRYDKSILENIKDLFGVDFSLCDEANSIAIFQNILKNRNFLAAVAKIDYRQIISSNYNDPVGFRFIGLTSEEFVPDLKLSSEMQRAIYEIFLLTQRSNFHRDIHPFVQTDTEFRKQYAELLMLYSCAEGRITGYQIVRLEEILRQFNLKTDWILSKLNEALAQPTSQRKKIILNKIKELDLRNSSVLLIDIVALHILTVNLYTDKTKLPSYLCNDKNKLQLVTAKLKKLL